MIVTVRVKRWSGIVVHEGVVSQKCSCGPWRKPNLRGGKHEVGKSGFLRDHFSKVFFIKKYIKIIFLFLTSINQNNLKISKILI